MFFYFVPALADLRLQFQTMSAITSDTFIDNIRSQISDNRTWNDPSHYGGVYERMADKGTANLAVIAENGDAVVATSTINYLYVAKRMRRSFLDFQGRLVLYEFIFYCTSADSVVL